MLKKCKAFLLRHELLIFILCFVAFMRLPSLMEPYWYGDEGIYLTLGNGIRHGLSLYKDIHDNKPPGIYVLAGIAGSLFWFRMLLLVWNLASVAVFHWIAEKIIKVKNASFKLVGITFPKPNLVTLATILFALLPVFTEGNIANGEIFMVLPVLIGMALLLLRRGEKNLAKQRSLAALAGFTFALAFLIKVPSIFEAIAAGLFFFIYPESKNLKIKLAKILHAIFSWDAWIFGLMFLLPIIGTIIYYQIIGAGKEYLGAALLQNVGYLSSWSTGNQQANLGKTGLSSRAVGLGLTSLVLLSSSPILAETVVFCVLWFGFALFGALLSERPYPHYLMQIVAPISLLIPLLLQNLTRGETKKRTKIWINSFVVALALGLMGLSVITLKFWHYPLTNYYKNYFNFVTKRISRDQYFAYFDPTLPEQYKLANYIATYTTPQDRIFIWADLPNLYALTRRLPPGRFTAAYHVKDFNGFEETLAAITRTSPKFILIDRRQDAFPHLDGILADEYLTIYRSKVFVLYRRLNN